MSEKNKAIVRRWLEEVLNKDNLAVVDGLCAPSYACYVPGIPRLVGREEMKQMLMELRTGFPDMHCDIDDIVAEGDKVVARFRFYGTHTGEFRGVAPTNENVSVTGVDVKRISNGQVIEDRPVLYQLIEAELTQAQQTSEQAELLYELKYRRDQAQIVVKNLQRSVVVSAIFFLGCLILTPISWWYFEKYFGGTDDSFTFFAPFVPLFYGLAALTTLLAVQARYRNERQALEDLSFEIDLLQFQVSRNESRAEKVLRINEIQLRRYYNLNLSQNIWVFCLGIFCIILGFVVISITLFLVHYGQRPPNVQIITAAVGTTGSVLANFVAVIYLRMHAGATDTLGRFHERLVETHQALLGNLLASRIEDKNKRWDTLSQLSLNLIKHDQQQTGTPSQNSRVSHNTSGSQ